jgi:DNA-binding response OmpR family regulator
VRLFIFSTLLANAAGNVIRRQVLVVDDDPAIRTLLRLVAERRGLSVDVASDGAEALQHLAERQYDLAVIDLMMPRVNGYELVAAIRGFDQRPAVVIATAGTDSLVGMLDAEIVHSIIRKPFDIEMIAALMSAIVTQDQPASAELDDFDLPDARNLPADS